MIGPSLLSQGPILERLPNGTHEQLEAAVAEYAASVSSARRMEHGHICVTNFPHIEIERLRQRNLDF